VRTGALEFRPAELDVGRELARVADGLLADLVSVDQTEVRAADDPAA